MACGYAALIAFHVLDQSVVPSAPRYLSNSVFARIASVGTRIGFCEIVFSTSGVAAGIM